MGKNMEKYRKTWHPTRPPKSGRVPTINLLLIPSENCDNIALLRSPLTWNAQTPMVQSLMT